MSPANTVEHGILRDGYRFLSDIIAESDDHDTFIFPRFSRLSARNLLHLASELYAIEDELSKSDDAVRWSKDKYVPLSMKLWETFSMAEADANCDAAVRQQLRDRRELFARLADKMKEYQEALLLQSQTSSLARPRRRTVKILRRRFKGENSRDKTTKLRPLLNGRAAELFDDENDLAALRPPLSNDPLSQLLQDHWPGKRNPNHDPRDRTAFVPSHHITRTVAAISMLAAATLLVGAIASLYFVRRPGARLGLVALFTLLFAFAVGTLTTAKRSELFAATAAYAAVLVVFVSGNLSP